MQTVVQPINHIPSSRETPDQLFSPGLADNLDCDDKGLPDEQNLTLLGLLISNKVQKEDVIQFIQKKTQTCLLHIDKPEQPESYFFWNLMELFCKKNRKVFMAEVGIVLFKAYSCAARAAYNLRKAQKDNDWCLRLARLSSANMPEDELRRAVIDLGDSLATEGLTFAAHLCYVVAYKESAFELIGCESMPIKMSDMMEAIERTEVYAYALGLTSGFAHPNFQDFRVLYCQTITKAAAAFPGGITNTCLDLIIQLSEELHEGKGEEPEWLLNLRLLQKRVSPLGTSIEEEQQTESSEDCSKKSEQHNAFQYQYLSEEVTLRYRMEELLGCGGGGAVFAGVRKSDGRKVAIKFIPRDKLFGKITIPGEINKVPVEVGLMQMLSKMSYSPYVLELQEWFEIPKFDVLILERPSPSMDLLQFLKLHGGKLPEPLARDIMHQVVQAALHCCNCQVFHNDIKPGNILINTQTLQVKLIDFGSGDLLKTTPYTYCPGTSAYYPPEWYQRKRYMGQSVTIWTLGVVLYQMLHGHTPFKTSEEIINGNLQFSPGLSKDCCKFILWCLQKDPNYRPNFKQILKHKWLMGRPKYFESFPVIGGLVSKVADFFDYLIK